MGQHIANLEKPRAEQGFAARNNCNRLVWYEHHDDRETALAREYAIKRWRRDWKETSIEDLNPDWRDLSEDLKS